MSLPFPTSQHPADFAMEATWANETRNTSPYLNVHIGRVIVHALFKLYETEPIGLKNMSSTSVAGRIFLILVPVLCRKACLGRQERCIFF